MNAFPFYFVDITYERVALCCYDLWVYNILKSVNFWANDFLARLSGLARWGDIIFFPR